MAESGTMDEGSTDRKVQAFSLGAEATAMLAQMTRHRRPLTTDRQRTSVVEEIIRFAYDSLVSEGKLDPADDQLIAAGRADVLRYRLSDPDDPNAGRVDPSAYAGWRDIFRK